MIFNSILVLCSRLSEFNMVPL